MQTKWGYVIIILKHPRVSDKDYSHIFIINQDQYLISFQHLIDFLWSFVFTPVVEDIELILNVLKFSWLGAINMRIFL